MMMKTWAAGAGKAVGAAVAVVVVVVVVVGATLMRILFLERQLVHQTSALAKKFFGDGNGDGNAEVRESRKCA